MVLIRIILYFSFMIGDGGKVQSPKKWAGQDLLAYVISIPEPECISVVYI